MMQKRRPGMGGADLRGGDQLCPTKSSASRPLLDSLAAYRALTLMSHFGMRPELAAMLAGLAFGGGR